MYSSVEKYLLDAYYVKGTVLDASDKMVNQIDKTLP
jgi:hypothetical protein